MNFGLFTLVGEAGPSQERKGLPVTAIYISPCFGYMYS